MTKPNGKQDRDPIQLLRKQAARAQDSLQWLKTALEKVPDVGVRDYVTRNTIDLMLGIGGRVLDAASALQRERNNFKAQIAGLEAEIRRLEGGE